MAPGSPFGNAITNEILYMGNVLGQGRIPYLAPNATLKQKTGRSSVPLRSDQLPRGAYMTEPGRVYGIDSTQVGRAGGYMDEMGRVSFPPGNQVNPSSWGAPSSLFSRPSSRNSIQAPSSFSASSPAAERAYQSEASRVAQLTAQDPELQRYERARRLAVAPGATAGQVQSAEDIGMQMWAKANPTLAAKVKPGQAGYDTIQGTLAGQAAAQGHGFQMPQQIIPTPPPGVTSPQGLPAVNTFEPTATFGNNPLQVDPEMAKKFQALLNATKQ